MRIRQLAEMLAGMDQNAEIFVAFYTKEEAEEYIQRNLNEGDEFPLTDNQWQDIIQQIDHEDEIFQELGDSFTYHCESMFNKIQKERVSNVSSK